MKPGTTALDGMIPVTHGSRFQRARATTSSLTTRASKRLLPTEASELLSQPRSRVANSIIAGHRLSAIDQSKGNSKHKLASLRISIGAENFDRLARVERFTVCRLLPAM